MHLINEPIVTTLLKADLFIYLNMQTIKRFGSFEDISNVTDFFINDESSFITGQKIYLGGL